MAGLSRLPDPTPPCTEVLCNRGLPRNPKATMSKLEFITYIKSRLVTASSECKSAQPPDFGAAGRLDHIVRTAELLNDGYWNRLAGLYDPLSPVLMHAVTTLNAEITAGVYPTVTFDEYVSLLVAGVSEPVLA